MARDRVAATVADRTRDFAKRLAWSLSVPGQHAGGVSYDALLGYLAEQGRDFTAPTKSVRDHVRLRLQEHFEGYQRAPNLTELKRVAAAAVLEWVVMRFDRKVDRSLIRANDPAYIRIKVAQHKMTVPGQRTGELRDAVADKGRVEIEG